MSAAFQYYQPLASLHNFATYIQQSACRSSNCHCLEATDSLSSASSVDVDFDAISHAVVVTATWAQSPDGATWTETTRSQSESDTIEVGALNSEKAEEAEELSLGGFLTVLGENDKPSKLIGTFWQRYLLTFPQALFSSPFPHATTPCPHLRSRQHFQPPFASPQAYTPCSSSPFQQLLSALRPSRALCTPT